MNVRKSKTRYIILIIIILIIAGGSFGVYKYNSIRKYNELVNQANELMKQQDYEQAIALFSKSLGVKSNESIENNIKFATKLKENKDAFDEGIKLMADKKYKSAIDEFKKVGNNDDKLYFDAQNKISECTGLFISDNIQLANEAIKNKKYDDANKYVDEITKLDNNNVDAHKIKNTVLLEKSRNSVNEIIGPELHAVYEEKESNINGKEYFIFYEVSKDGTYSDRRYCVDKSNGEIFIQSSDNSFVSYKEYLVKRQQYEDKVKDLKNAVLGHWIDNYGEQDWYSQATLSTKGRIGTLDQSSYTIIYDFNSVKSIINSYRSVYENSGGAKAVSSVFSDEVIENCVIVKSKNTDGSMFNTLLNFSNDRSWFSLYILDRPSKGDIMYSSEYKYVDSVQNP